MRNNPTVQGWLINLPLNVKQITQELIEIARKNMPGAVVGWRREEIEACQNLERGRSKESHTGKTYYCYMEGGTQVDCESPGGTKEK